MNQINAQAAVKYMKGLWPNWKPTDIEAAFWCDIISGYDDEMAVRTAIQEAKKSSDFSKPPAKKLNDLLRSYNSKQGNANTEQPEPTVFLFYEGGGRSTLLAGHFMPITPGIYAGKTDLERADMWQVAYSEAHGGLWKVYRDTTHSAMIKMRKEIRAESVDEFLEAAK